MKKVVCFLVAFLLVLLPLNALEIDLNINVDNPAPQIWISDYTIEPDDRDGYAVAGFPGDIIIWHYLVRNYIGSDKIGDVHYELDTDGGGNCYTETITGYIDFANVDFNPAIDRYGTCQFSVADFHYGDTTITTIVEDILGNEDSASFNIFLNPKITLSATPLTLNVVGMAGQSVLQTVNIQLDVEGGAEAKIYITGTDFSDSRSFPTRCPTTNRFGLENILYKVVSSNFKPVPYKDTDPNSLVGIFSNDFDITFQINIPTPCLGSFDTGSIFIEGEIV